MVKATAATKEIKEGVELSLPSFRDGISFMARKPNADGFIAIMDSLTGPQGQMLKTVAFEVLKRSYPDVTEKEVGNMEFEDFVPLLKVGLNGLQELDSMGFQDISEMRK